MDISSAVFDPELGSTSFTVERITYTRSREGTGGLHCDLYGLSLEHRHS